MIQQDEDEHLSLNTILWMPSPEVKKINIIIGTTSQQHTTKEMIMMSIRKYLLLIGFWVIYR